MCRTNAYGKIQFCFPKNTANNTTDDILWSNRILCSNEIPTEFQTDAMVVVLFHLFRDVS